MKRVTVISIFFLVISITSIACSINENSFYGKWQITGVLETSNISALEEEQIAAIIGKELTYSPEMAQYGSNICNNPFYEVTEYEAEKFMVRNKLSLKELGIDDEKVIAIDVYEDDKRKLWDRLGSVGIEQHSFF